MARENSHGTRLLQEHDQIMKNNKEIYRAHADGLDLPLFFKPWFLDAACGEDAWDVVFSRRDKTFTGVWPYYRKEKLGLSTLTLPPLTPYLGPRLFVPADLVKSNSKRSFCRKVLTTLASELPDASRIMVQGDPKWDNWRPLSWKDYHQTTRYTLRVDLRKREDELYAELKDKTRNLISQARDQVQIRKAISAKEVYDLTMATFDRQQLQVPYDLSKFTEIYDAIMHHESGLGLIGEISGVPSAGIFIGTDHDTSYLMSAGRSNDAHNGAVSLLIWESMMQMKKQGILTYDFEGSMIEGIASFFDGFGGTLTPYHRVTKTKTKMHRFLFQLLGKI